MEKILIVDDDANMRESLCDNLEAAGYSVAQAESGAAALAKAREEFFAVVLMDYNLTDATGIEVIKRIRAVSPDSQILMLTAHASLDTAVKAIRESVTDFLSKPVDFDKLKHSVALALGKLRLERENKRLMASLRQANEQLSNMSQMKSKFMSMSSHDLANALMTLQVSFDMLCSGLTPSEEQKKRIAYILSGINQIARLTGDLVDWASIEQGKLRLERGVFAPGPMAEESLTGPQGRAQARGISLSISVEPGLPEVSADKRRIVQVLNNLLENAVRHTPRGGKIEVLVSRAETPASARAEVLIAVRDSGSGISPDEAGKIFQSFYQGHGQEEGGRLGLGLSIAKEIISAHGGRLWAESPGEGRGATFLFTLPAAS